MINRHVTMEFRNGKIKMNNELIIFEGDYNIRYLITLIIGYSMTDTYIVDNFGSGRADMIFIKEDGSGSSFSLSSTISDGPIELFIDQNVSEMLGVGDWTIVMSLSNAEGTGRLTLAPFELKVLPLINNGGGL